MARTSCEKEISAPSRERARKQDEALFKGADAVRCIRELQTITIAETGRSSGDIDMALRGSYDVAVGLAGEKAGRNGNEQDILKEFGYPDIFGD